MIKMTFTCCVPGCKKSGEKVLHSFPKEILRCKRWIYNTKCFNINSETAYRTHYKVCKTHFKPSDYTSTMQKYLKKDVVPSLHLPGLEVAQKYLCLKNGRNQGFKKFAAAFAPKEEEGVVKNAEFSSNLVNEKNQVLPNADIGQIVVVNSEQNQHLEKLAPANLVNQVLPNADIGQIVVVNSEQNQHFEKLAPANLVNQVRPNADIDGHIVAENEGPNQASNEPYLQAYLTDVVDDTDTAFCQNNIEGATNAAYTDNIHSTTITNIVDLNDVLVPEIHRITNHPVPTCKRPEPTTGRTSNYNPAARRARYQATRIKFLTQKLRDSEKLKQSKILDYLEKKLDANQMTFVRMQIKNAGRKPRGHRFNFEEKCMAFAVFKQSPKCYRRLLSKILTLPCKQTLMKHSASVRFEAGINPTLMQFLSDVVKDMNGTDKIVTLGWDEISLNAHLDYCKVKDYIDGFVDDGKKRCDEFATHSLVFMIRGVHKSYKQPIAYFFTQNITKNELAELITLVTEAVLDVGLNVIGSVCDAVATNLAAVRALMEPKFARMPKFCLNLLEYRIRNAPIIHFFDPPHLIKSIRNNMLTKDLHHYVATKKSASNKTDKIDWNNQNKVERVASWDDVTEFYQYNQKGINQLLTKITDEHIDPKKKKMKVSVAVQVFSRTFGTTMRYCSEKKQLPWDFTGTADILIFFNEVFDSLNGDDLPSVNNSLKGSIHQQSYHFTFWKYAVEMLKKMRFVPKDPSVQERSRVLNDYILTINGLAELTKRLFDLQIESVSLRKMTQDALENFFGGIRSYCQAAKCPTPRNFRTSYATSLLNNLSSSHSMKSNCEEDGGIPLIQDLFLKFMNKGTNKTGADLEECESDPDEEVDLGSLQRKLSTAENEAGNLFAGHICRTVLKLNQCLDCQKTITSRGKNEKCHGLLTAISQYSATDNQLIMYPKPKFIESFKELESTLEKLVPLHCSQKPLSKTLIQATGPYKCFAGCDIHKTDLNKKIASLTSEIIITTFTTKVNNFLSGKLEALNAPYDHIQEAAFIFRQKKKHIGKYNESNE